MHPVHVIPSTCSPESVAILAIAMAHDGGSTVSTRKRDGLLVDGLKTWEEREANKENWEDWRCSSQHGRHAWLYGDHREWSLSSRQCKEARNQRVAAGPMAWPVQEMVASLHGSACRFKQAIPCRHNQGAVSWVRLEEPKKTRTTLTSDGPPPPRDWLGGCWKPCVASAASAPSDSCTSSWCCFGMCGLVGWMASARILMCCSHAARQGRHIKRFLQRCGGPPARSPPNPKEWG